MYEITITRMILKKVPAGEVWKVVRDELFTEEEAREASELYTRSDKQMPVKEVMGYTPKIIKEEHVEIDILKQTVADLDLTAVIKAINGIK